MDLVFSETVWLIIAQQAVVRISVLLWWKGWGRHPEGSGKPLIFQIEKHANKDLLIFSRYSNIWMLLIYIRCRSGCLVSVLVAHQCTAVVRPKSLFLIFFREEGRGVVEWRQRFWVGLHTSANKGPRCFPKQYFLCTPTNTHPPTPILLLMFPKHFWWPSTK